MCSYYRWDKNFSTQRVCPNTWAPLHKFSLHDNDGTCPSCGTSGTNDTRHAMKLSGKLLTIETKHVCLSKFIQMDNIRDITQMIEYRPYSLFKQLWPDYEIPFELLPFAESESNKAEKEVLNIDPELKIGAISDEEEKVPFNFDKPPLPWPFLCLLFLGLGIIIGATMAL